MGHSGEEEVQPEATASAADSGTGDVTPLARVELVRQPFAPAAPPAPPPDLDLDEAQVLSVGPGAIPLKRSQVELPPKSGPVIGIDLGS